MKYSVVVIKLLALLFAGPLLSQVDSVYLGQTWQKVVQFTVQDTALKITSLSSVSMRAHYLIDPHTRYDFTFDTVGKLNYMAFFIEEVTDEEMRFWNSCNDLIKHGYWLDGGDKDFRPGPTLPNCMAYSFQRSFKHFEIEGMEAFVGIADCIYSHTLEIKFFYLN